MLERIWEGIWKEFRQILAQNSIFGGRKKRGFWIGFGMILERFLNAFGSHVGMILLLLSS